MSFNNYPKDVKNTDVEREEMSLEELKEVLVKGIPFVREKYPDLFAEYVQILGRMVPTLGDFEDSCEPD